MAVKFDWEDNDTWPQDRKDYVFLASAVRAYGTAKLGTDWKICKKLACQNVAAAIADGELLFVVRPEEGGEFSEFQPYGVFNSEEAIKLFDRCMWTPNYYRGRNQSISLSNFYIFVERRGLDALIQPSPPPEKDAENPQLNPQEPAGETPVGEASAQIEGGERAAIPAVEKAKLTPIYKAFIEAIQKEFPNGLPDDGTPQQRIDARILKTADRPKGDRSLQEFRKLLRQGRIDIPKRPNHH